MIKHTHSCIYIYLYDVNTGTIRARTGLHERERHTQSVTESVMRERVSPKNKDTRTCSKNKDTLTRRGWGVSSLEWCYARRDTARPPRAPPLTYTIQVCTCMYTYLYRY